LQEHPVAIKSLMAIRRTLKEVKRKVLQKKQEVVSGAIEIVTNEMGQVPSLEIVGTQ
jgi:hypothetical protein